VNSTCTSLVISANLVIQVGFVKLTNVWPAKGRADLVYVIRRMAFAYNGNVFYVYANDACQSSNPNAMEAAGIKPNITGMANQKNYTGTFVLSDGTTITFSNSMAAYDKDYAMDINIGLPPHYMGGTVIKGACGDYDGNRTNDFIGADGVYHPVKPPTVWLADANDMGNSWHCNDTLNLFTCGSKCSGIPKPNTVPASSICKFVPPPPVTTTAVVNAYKTATTQAALPTGAPPVPCYTNMTAAAEAACNVNFKPDPTCRDLFLPQEGILKTCVSDADTMAQSMCSLAVVDSMKSAYLTQLAGITAPIIQEPTHPLYQSAISCRKAQGLGDNDCPANCGGPTQGTCSSHGCTCQPAWLGVDCLAPNPMANNLANGGATKTGAVLQGSPSTSTTSTTTAAPAPAPTGSVVPAPWASFSCDDDQYPGQHPYSNDNCHALTGDPGIFDDYADQMGKNNSAVKVCKDRNLPPGGVTQYCMQHNGVIGAHMNCTGDDTAQDNVFSPTCSAGYRTGTAACYPTDPNTPLGPGSCKDKDKPSPQLSQFELSPCDYFPNFANTRSFYCIGISGRHLLMCPDNFITECSNGCYSMMDGKLQCGRAACAAGSKQLPMPFGNAFGSGGPSPPPTATTTTTPSPAPPPASTSATTTTPAPPPTTTTSSTTATSSTATASATDDPSGFGGLTIQM